MDFLTNIDFWFLVITSLAKTVFVLGVVLGMVSYTVYAERRVSAFIQDRLGPNRVGPQGLIQPIADAVKLLIKEDFTPSNVNTLYYWLAPALGIGAVIVSLAVIPFGSTLDLDFVFKPILGRGFGPIPMVIANVNVGILFIFAISSLAVYGIVLAGWSANSKYPFLGGIRSSSQMISYELALGLSVVPLFLIYGKLNLVDIVHYQIENGWLLFPPFAHGVFSFSANLLCVSAWISFIIFSVSMFAETNRLPFDLPEAEQELVGGYNTEYSSMKFALFFLGEYAAMIAGSAAIVTLFLGGWHFPFIPSGGQGFFGFFWGLVNIAVFFAKVAALLFIFIWVRWTLPRFRYDQLMKLGWIWFFEIALVNIFIAAGILALAH
jgi:NADH-quinone oxidoreductase subunit H